jgi:DNA gyrase subunit A
MDMNPIEFERPNLHNLDPEIRGYIEALEAEIDRLTELNASSESQPRELTPVEPPGPLNVITATAAGLAKRTPAHFYARQRRGGMGIFDLDAPSDDPPVLVSLADDDQTVLLITNTARAFRMPVSAIPETPIRARGSSIAARLGWRDDERLAALLPVQAQGYLVLLSRSGMVRSLRHHIFGEYMKPGIPLLSLIHI